MTSDDFTYTRTGRILTRTGIVIGGAIVDHGPREVSDDALRVQRGLLRERLSLGERIVGWLEGNRWVSRFCGF